MMSSSSIKSFFPTRRSTRKRAVNKAAATSTVTSDKSSSTSSSPSKVPKVSKASKTTEKTEQQLRRERTRFNGLTESEVLATCPGLPDYLRPHLDIVFVGINPGLCAAFTGHYYDGPGNHFWTALHLSGLVDAVVGPSDDHTLMDRFNIGFTNVVARVTRGLSDLSREEIRQGSKILKAKMELFKPKIVVFNGKSIYEVYCENKKFLFGKQPATMVDHVHIWVMPSSSARCAQLPRAIDKVPFFKALKMFRDHLKGLGPMPDEAEVVFANVVLSNKIVFNKNKQSNKVKSEPIDDNDNSHNHVVDNNDDEASIEDNNRQPV